MAETQRICNAASPDGTRCDRPEKHWGKHDGPIQLSAKGINQWTWDD